MDSLSCNREEINYEHSRIINILKDISSAELDFTSTISQEIHLNSSLGNTKKPQIQFIYCSIFIGVFLKNIVRNCIGKERTHSMYWDTNVKSMLMLSWTTLKLQPQISIVKHKSKKSLPSLAHKLVSALSHRDHWLSSPSETEGGWGNWRSEKLKTSWQHTTQASQALKVF